MNNFLKLTAVLMLALASGKSALAADVWRRLASQEVASTASDVVIDVSKQEAAVKAVRLEAKSGAVGLSKVVVSYRGGREHVEMRSIRLEAGDRTRTIDPRDQEALLDRVTISVLEPSSKRRRVAIELWGLISAPGIAQSDDADALSDEAVRLYDAGKYVEGIPLAERVLAIREKALGPEHPDVGVALNDLARLYDAQGRYGDAEPLYKRSLDIAEKSLGADSPVVAERLLALAHLNYWVDRYAEAEPLFRRALQIREKILGADHPDTLDSLLRLARNSYYWGHYADAASVYQRLLASRERTLGPDHEQTAESMADLADCYSSQEQFVRAEKLYKRALAITVDALGRSASRAVTLIGKLGDLYNSNGRFAEAEPLLLEALTTAEQIYGPSDKEVARRLSALAGLYRRTNRAEDAAKLYARALEIKEKSYGADSLEVAFDLDFLSESYRTLGRIDEAISAADRSFSIRENRLGAESVTLAWSLLARANLYFKREDYERAAALYERALNLWRQEGINETMMSYARLGLAMVNYQQKRYAESEALYREIIEKWTSLYGEGNPLALSAMSGLVDLYFDLDRNDDALATARRAAHEIRARSNRVIVGYGDTTASSEQELEYDHIGQYLKVAYKVAVDNPDQMPVLLDEALEVAQLANKASTGAALSQMSARFAATSEPLQILIRERQELAVEWKNISESLRTAAGRRPEERGPEWELQRTQLAEVGNRLEEIAAQLGREFPEYTDLANPKPLSVAQAQALLVPNEVIVSLLDRDIGAYVWVLTRQRARWYRAPIGTSSLSELVTELRCGLDRDGEWMWENQSRRWLAKKAPCRTRWPDGLKEREPLPFDPAKANELYNTLLGPAADLLVNPDGTGKHLLLVPSGPLTSLPFQVLVTNAPEPATATTSLEWLAKRHALTVLPSVASLASLRRNTKGSAGSEPFIAFADPVLTRNCPAPSTPKACPGAAIETASTETVVTRSAGEMDTAASFMRGGLADVAALKSRLCPLPDTAFEVACVGDSLGSEPSNLVLGKDMTESKVKNMALDKYRIVHFATHGLLAGETAQLAEQHAEPALVFSPPDVPTEQDDGLLTASEVAGLKLDADWVVMSACNTAGGGAPGAEALSGLARAFFFAGARALLVSHWPVNSTAATMLTTRTFAELKRDPGIGRAEAFRRSMLALIGDNDRPWAAHPSVWAPFVLVGEGGRVGP